MLSLEHSLIWEQHSSIFRIHAFRIHKEASWLVFVWYVTFRCLSVFAWQQKFVPQFWMKFSIQYLTLLFAPQIFSQKLHWLRRWRETFTNVSNLRHVSVARSKVNSCSQLSHTMCTNLLYHHWKIYTCPPRLNFHLYYSLSPYSLP